MHNIYYLGLSGERSLPFGLLVSLLCTLIECSNRSFSNSISEKTTKGILMKFSQCPFKNIFHRLPLSNRGIYIQIIHVRRKAIFTFYGTCIACVNNITFSNWIFYMTVNLLIRKTETIAQFVAMLCSTLF